MTPQDIHQKIEFFKKRTEELMKQDNCITEIDWQITDVPYAVFDTFRRGLNEGLTDKEEYRYVEEIVLCGKAYCVPVRGYGKGANIYIWSVPVKFKHTYEVIEEIKEPAL